MAGVERRVNVGQTYCVTPSVDCTVSTLGGTELVNVAAGSQDYFVAPAGTVVVSDAGARLTASRSPAWLASRSPAWLAELRAGLEELGLVYKLAWMPAGEKLVVHTDRADDTQLEQVAALLERVLPQNIELVQYNHNIEVSWRDKLYKYADCVTVDDMIAVNPDYQNDLTSDGEWLYELPKLRRLFRGDDWWNGGLFCGNKKIKKWSVDLPSVVYFGSAFRNSSIEEFYGKTPAYTTPTTCCSSTALYMQSGFTFLNTPLRIFVGDLSKAKVLDYDTFGNLKHLEVFETELTSADYLMCFDGCQFNKNIAITILSKFQSKENLKAMGLGTRCIGKIGIHVDYKNDEEVLAAIAEVEAKGWNLTVQWNGTPTSTASTMSFGQLIYATVDVKERPDGTVEGSLIWGHYVTDPTGYETFRSLESAYEYFGLEMPAEEELSS